jgi:5'(3')-deoxyribonucleotidase
MDTQGSRNDSGSSRSDVEHHHLCSPNNKDLDNGWKGRVVFHVVAVCRRRYGLVIGASALSRANAASIVFAGTCLVLKLIKEKKLAEGNEGKPERLRIAVDMDETIADSFKEHRHRYNQEFGENVTADDLYGKNLEDFAILDRAQAVRRMVRDESFFERLKVITGAQEVIRELARRHEVFIVSAAMEIPESFAAKHRWLQKYFPFIARKNIVFYGNKGIVDADYLIDDEARHFSSFCGNGILFPAPHNAKETRYQRSANWRAVHTKFLGELRDRERLSTERTKYAEMAVGE